MGYFTNLKKDLTQYLDDDEVALIEQAYIVARKAHQGQKRRSGEPYITHPVAAARILASMRLDYQSIIATLLHDVIEDTDVGKEELAAQFGEEVAELVDGVSKLTQINFESRAEAQAENFRKMVLAMVRDIRVIIVKLADRLHNMRTLEYMPSPKRKIKARETLEIYAPIANRLGIHSFYVELEDLGFAALYPMRYRILSEAVKRSQAHRKKIIDTLENRLSKTLKEHNIDIVEVYGRQKHIYSIYRKMRQKHTSFSDIMDVYGLRIITQNRDDCYRVLGVVHGFYKPYPERFKDYIALPKANGYQALHTTLFGEHGIPIEIQIRSKNMDRIAEKGVAAHWIYKTDVEANEAQVRARNWVRGLLEMQQSSGSSLEFIESVKIDLFPEEVYVFTPKGEIMELPRGATPVDFAYAIHSDIGNSCVAAKINRRLAPLSSLLENGQTVEVVTAPGAQPNPNWLSFVATGKARSNIRHYLKGRRFEESVSFGKRLLNQALDHFQTSYADLHSHQIDRVVKEYHYPNSDELLADIGIGNQVALLVAKRLMSDDHLHDETCLPIEESDKKPIVIKGTEGIVVNYAKCCHPIPGDTIMGYLDTGHGLIVHTDNCPVGQKLRKHRDRVIDMSWESNISGEFTCDVDVHVINQRGVLALLANAIAETQGNIDNIRVEPRDGRYSLVYLALNVHDRAHLARIIRKVRRIPAVSRVVRRRPSSS